MDRQNSDSNENIDHQVDVFVDNSLKSWLSLTLIRGLGGESLRTLLKEFGSPEAVLSASASSLSPHVKSDLVRAILSGADEAQLTTTLHWLADTNNSIVTLADSDYPQALLNISDPPVLLYIKGNKFLLNQPTISIVGSRHATPQGIHNAESFSEALSSSGLSIISGLAHGIDAAAHRGGLKGVGSSIAVVGTGLDKVYPAANRDLAHELARQGLIISEFPIGTPPLAANFPRRNRLISGMGLGCLVVEASLKSGSLITARLAMEQGRDVFAIPGSIHSPQSKGCHALIKQGAKLVEAARDILEELGSVNISASIVPTESAAESELFQYMGDDAVDLDKLQSRSGLTVSELSAMLLSLELDGLVCTLPGGLFQRIYK